ncbi:MAG: NUDIX domain-containing protein, partial [Bacteroidia bacterium]|nr:NUDIX domain-containing protein [Bacteroidia bacterium]
MVIKTHPGDVIKYCPRCGCNAFKTNDKGRSFNCEGCHFDYYINNSAAVACLIFNAEGKLLLARRAIEPGKGMLDLPGGFVEPKESAEAAVIREIKEELGVKVTNVAYLASFPNEYIYSGFSVFTVDLAFICTIDNLEAIFPADDVSEVEFIFPQDVKKEELCSESMANIISQYINKYIG